MKQNKSKTHRLSVKWLLFISLATFTAVILLLLWFSQVAFFKEFYKTIKINDVKQSAERIVYNIESGDLSKTVDELAQTGEMCVMVLNFSDSTTLAQSHVLPNCRLHKMPAAQLLAYAQRAADNGGTDLELSYQGRNDLGTIPDSSTLMQSIMYTRLVYDNDHAVRYAVMLNANVFPVNSTAQTLWVLLVINSGIMLIIALGLAFIFAQKISLPIARINRTAKALARENYKVHFDTGGYREIAELGQTLNYVTRELSKADQARKDLIANVSHDLRTPLTMMTGYSEMLRDLPGENTPENIQVIIDEAKRLTELVNDLLDISKLQSGTQKLELTRYNFTQSVREIMTRYEKLTEQEGCTITFEAKKDVYITADEGKINQVIYNLVNNAITHTGSDKTVRVRQIVERDGVRLEVIDTGEGIAPEQLRDIWNRYYKVDQEHKRAQKGTGLGLSIVKNIMELHYAPYGVRSTPGKGSIFWIKLKYDNS